MALVWVLETSTDPVVLPHVLHLAPEVYWPDEVIKRLPWELVQRILAGLADCFRRNDDGSLEIPTSLRHRAMAFSVGFLFFFWEKLALDLEGFKTWADALGEGFVEEHWHWASGLERISDETACDESTEPTEDAKVFTLVYWTIRHLYYAVVQGVPAGSVYRCRTSASTMDTLLARTMVYLAQQSHIPAKVSSSDWFNYTIYAELPSLELIILYARQAQSVPARAVYLLACGIMLRPSVDDLKNSKGLLVPPR